MAGLEDGDGAAHVIGLCWYEGKGSRDGVSEGETETSVKKSETWPLLSFLPPSPT